METINPPILVNGVWRMDWGYGNPNLTAALIVSLMALVWLPAFLCRRGFWISLPMFSGLLVCLVHTMSRGGLLGGLCAMGVLAWMVPRPWPKARLLAVIVSVWIGFGAVVWLKSYERLGQGIAVEDKSVSNRLLVWKSAPVMLADAPLGWGINRAGDAYMEWYQPLDRQEIYGSLVSTHLTKIVELGLFGSVVYVFLWGLAFLFSWPTSRAKWLAVPLAVLVGFGIAACFTNMGRNPTLWILPVGAGLGSVLKVRVFPSRKAMLGIGVLSVCVVGLMFAGGAMQQRMPLRGGRDGVAIGSGVPDICVVRDVKTLGSRPGRALRVAYEKVGGFERCVLLLAAVSEMPKNFSGTLVLAGEMGSRELPAVRNTPLKRLLVLNPTMRPEGLKGAASVREVCAFFGEYSSTGLADAWEKVGKVSLVSGAGDYLAGWPALVLENGKEIQ